ncbi:MAG: ABC transporter ATP-binding protein [Acidothermus sp.]|nr:ABC transporter ATP-binding protein [Acidothermus sp.]
MQVSSLTTGSDTDGRSLPEGRKRETSVIRLKVHDVSVYFDAFVALSHVNLEVRRGEIVSLVGPSGCGKSTLLNAVSGLVSLGSGEVYIDGRRITEPGPDRVVVFQEDAVFPWMRVWDNIEFPLKIRKVPKHERRSRVHQLLNLVGLQEVAQRYPVQLSGGMRKRVDVARALAAQPLVVLMDEPFAALDQMTKQTLQDEVLNLAAKEELTAVFVTHDLEEAIYMGDRVVVMDQGIISTVMEVPFHRPRDSAIRTTPEFQELRAHLFEAISRKGANDAQDH